MSGSDRYVERLVVGVGYETETASIHGVMGEFRGAFDALTGYSAALLSAAIAGGVFAFAQASAIDETGDLAEELRTTTEALTALQYAAGQKGAGVEVLTAGLRRLDMALAEASSGQGPAADAMRDLGLKTEYADGRMRDAVGSIGDIADALSRVQDDGRRNEILFDLFGRQATRLRPLLSQGADGIAEMTDRARRLGLVLDQDLADQAGQLMDTTEGLRGVIRSLGWDIAEVLIPPLTDGVEGLTDWLVASDGVVRSGLDRFLRGLTWTFEQLETPQGKVTAGVVGLAGAIGGASGLNAALRGIPALGPIAAGLSAVALPAVIVAGALGLTALAIEDLVVFASGGDSVIGRFFERFGEYDHALGSTTALLDEAGRAGTEFVGVITLIGDTLTNEVSRSFGLVLPDLAAMAGYIAGLEATRLEDRIDAWVGAFRTLADVLHQAAEDFTPGSFLRGLVDGTSLSGSAQLALTYGPADAFGAAFGAATGTAARGAMSLADEVLPPVAPIPTRAEDARAGGITVNVGDVIARGFASAQEMADAAAEAVRAQILRETNAVELLR